MSKYTFYEFFNEFYSIEIPAMQRDYAQGRLDAEEIRNSFLSYLYEKLIEGCPDTLDFIYGIVDENLQKLILIDGQQRMTTVFLLYWFLALTGDEQSRREFKHKLKDDGDSSRFRYAIRHSSKEFCNELVSRIGEFDKSFLSDRVISDIIMNQKWFKMQWRNDPTVKSMLTMLDTMQRKFADCEAGLYQKLEKVFTIDFLNLEDFSSHDAGRLYIKMNSRGKPLTRFENFKAKILVYINSKVKNGTDYEGLMHNSFDVNSKDLAGLSFSDKIGWLFDIRWTEAIWSSLSEKEKNDNENFEDSLLDRILLHLIVIPMMNACMVQALESGEAKAVVDVDKLSYDDIFKALEDYDKDAKILSGIINFLNDLTILDSENGEWRLRSNLETYEWLDFGNYKYFQSLFSKIKERKIGLADILKLHAIYLYFSMHGDEFDSKVLKEWLRFSANIIVASNLDASEIIYSLESLTLLCKQFPSIDGNTIKDEKYRGLDSLQIEEEVEKKRLCKENQECGEEIIFQEEQLFGYFEGQLRFPLSYSGLLEKSCTPEAIVDFRNACEVLYSIFEKPIDVYNLLTRALLTKGEYMVPVKRNGVRSFLISKHRDYSWKRYLKEYDKDKGYFKELLHDLIDSDISDISKALNDIINSCDIDAFPSWRRILIRNSRIWENVKYLGNDKKDTKIWEAVGNGSRNVKIDDDSYKPDAWVIPIKGNICSGVQSELFSLDVYTKISDPSPFKEVIYFRSDIKDKANPSCTVLNDWRFGENNFAIDIARIDDSHIPATFSVRFFDRNGKAISPEILKELSEFVGNEKGDYYAKVEWANDECIVFLANLLSRLKTVVCPSNLSE